MIEKARFVCYNIRIKQGFALFCPEFRTVRTEKRQTIYPRRRIKMKKVLSVALAAMMSVCALVGCGDNPAPDLRAETITLS